MLSRLILAFVTVITFVAVAAPSSAPQVEIAGITSRPEQRAVPAPGPPANTCLACHVRSLAASSTVHMAEWQRS
ncbi:MAG: hypothetical protein ABI652_06650, partial [Acidobacteriota bacterium]